MSEQAWLWLGFVGLTAGAALILLIGKSRTPQEGMTTVLHGIVTDTAAGQGSIVQHDADSAVAIGRRKRA